MATDQEVAQRILGIQQAQQSGQIDSQTAQELMAESGAVSNEVVEMPIAGNAPPISLQPNPPAALAANPVPAVVVPEIDPLMANAAQNAAAQQDAQTFAMSGQGTPGDPTLQAPVAPEAMPADAEIAASAPAEAISTQPSIEQTQAAHETVVKPVQQAIAEHRATKAAQKDLQAEFAKQQQEYQHQQDQIQTEIMRQDDSVRQRSLPEIMQKGGFGEKLAAVIALMLGGLSQGLTGSKSNPVLDFIDKQVESQAQKDKLSQEGKLALKKQLMDVAQLKMQNMANQSQDLFHKQSLEQSAAKLEIDKQQVLGDQALKAADLHNKQTLAEAQKQADNGAPITDISVLSDKQKDNLVRLPDGSFRLGRGSKEVVDNFQKQIRPDLESGISGVDRIKALAQDFNRVTDLKKRAQIGTEIKALAGQLRVPLTGPGAMTEKEFDRLMDIVGDPTKLVAIPSLQQARLMQVQTKLKADLSAGFRRIGVDLPESRRDEIKRKFLSGK